MTSRRVIWAPASVIQSKVSDSGSKQPATTSYPQRLKVIASHFPIPVSQPVTTTTLFVLLGLKDLLKKD